LRMGHLLLSGPLRYYPRYEGSPLRCGPPILGWERTGNRLDCVLLGMKVNMPLVTLLTGAALGVGVLVASMLSPSSTASASSTGATSPSSPAFTFTAPASAASGTASATTPTTAPAVTTSAPAVTPTSASAPAVTPTSASAPTAAPATTPAATASSSKSYVPPMANYVAQVNGGGAAVAISVHKGKAVAYVCNGHAVAAWYRGTAAHGKLNLTGKNGATLSVNYGSGHATGSLKADGVHYSFSAPMVHGVVPTGQRPPGLYEATATVDGVQIKAGWIVLPDGSQVGSVEYDPNSAIPPTAQAPLLNLTTGTAQYDGVTLVASLISGLTGSGF